MHAPSFGRKALQPGKVVGLEPVSQDRKGIFQVLGGKVVLCLQWVDLPEGAGQVQ